MHVNTYQSVLRVFFTLASGARRLLRQVACRMDVFPAFIVSSDDGCTHSRTVQFFSIS